VKNFFITFVFALSLASPAFADITTGKFSTAQMFDIKWNISGGKLNASGFNYLMRSVPSATRMSSGDYEAIKAANQYFAFFDSTTNPGTFGMALYNSDGSLSEVIHNTGTFRVLADGAIFYLGNGNWGTLITTAQGYSIGDAAQFTIEQESPTNEEMSNWVPDSTTPLETGQTAPTNTAPVSNAGPDQYVASDALVTLDGTASSDPDDDTLTYAWSQTSGTTVTLSNSAASNPSFTAPALSVGDDDEVLVFSLTVNDGTVDSSSDTVTVTVQAPTNTAPVSNAGADQSVASDALVTLDGTASSDPDDDTLTYAWSQTSGTTVTLSNSAASNPSFTAPALSVGDDDEVLVFSLTVNDGTVDSSSDTVKVTVQAPSPTPTTEFIKNEATIRSMLLDESERTLSSTLSSNQRMMREAIDRFQASQSNLADCSDAAIEAENACHSYLATRNNIAFSIDGTAEISNSILSTSGSFFEQTGNFQGTHRRLIYGDFDVFYDGASGSQTATLTGRMAWEQMVSDQKMLGYFIGGELASSSIAGAFEGEQDRLGVTAGGYAVQQLDEQVYLDGFITYGIGRNNLDMADDVLALTSTYTTRTVMAGAALSGEYAYEQYKLRPELSFSYGKTWIGDVAFTGSAYSLVDDTLSLDAGSVSMMNLTFRPEFVIPMYETSAASIAPRIICEQVQTTTTQRTCGAGLELGLQSMSEDGLTNINAKLIADRVGSSNRRSFQLNFEQRF